MEKYVDVYRFEKKSKNGWVLAERLTLNDLFLNTLEKDTMQGEMVSDQAMDPLYNTKLNPTAWGGQQTPKLSVLDAKKSGPYIVYPRKDENLDN